MKNHEETNKTFMKTKNILKNFLFIVIFVLSLSLNSKAQIDSSSIAILDKMSFAVGNLQSCSLTLKTEIDVLDSRLGSITNTETANVILKAPDKFLISKNGDRGEKTFYYNGKNFVYYSNSTNVYSSVPAPPTIIQTIDSIHNTFGIDFPAADFFYPYFTDDLMEVSANIADLGITNVNGKKCFHIAGNTLDKNYQIWIADDGTYLPVKLNIVSVRTGSDEHYTAYYENWILNPELQNSMFEFSAPSDALKVRLTVKK